MILRLLVCALVLAGVSGCDLFVSPETRIDRAEQHRSIGQYRAAMAELKGVLQKQPENARARVALSRLSLHLGDAEGARKELDWALRGAADRASLLDLDASIELARGRFAEAKALLKDAGSLAPARRSQLLAQAHIGLGELEEADEVLRTARAASPADASLLIDVARLNLARGHREEATRAVDEALRLDERFPQAWALRGTMLLQARDGAGAVAAFRKALEFGRTKLPVPEETLAMIGMAEAHVAAGDLEAASATLKSIEARVGSVAPVDFLRGRIAFLRGDYPTATADMRRVLRAAPQFSAAHVMLGAALLAQGSLEQAEAELSRYLSQNPDDFGARKLLAQVHLTRRQPEAARRVIAEGGESSQEDAQLDWLLGAALLQSGSTADGVPRLERALAADPGNQSARTYLATAYLSDGRREQALALLEAIPPGKRDGTTRGLLLLANVSGKDRAAARRAVEQLVAANPDDAALLAVAGAYAFKSGDADFARGLLEKSIAVDPKGVAPRLSLARVDLARSDLDGAASQLRQVLKIDPNHQGAFIGLGGIAWLQGDRKQAVEWLGRAVSADPAAFEARLRLAELTFLEGDTNRAQGLLRQALSVATDRGSALVAVGEVLLRTGHLEEALARFNEAERAGSDAGAVNVARAQIALDRIDDARRTLEAEAARRGAASEAAIMLITLDARQGRTDAGLKRVAAARAAGLPPFATAELEGDLQMAARNARVALDLYARAIRERPSRGLAFKSYRARVAAKLPKPEAALTEWLDVSPEDRPVRWVLAQHYQQGGDREAAITQYETLLQTMATPDGPLLNNLAWLYYEAGDARAEGIAQRAYAAAPQVAAIADTYGWVLVESGKVAQGVTVLQEAVNREPGNLDLRVRLAAAQARAGRHSQARQLLESALRSGAQFASRADAERLLQGLPN